MIELIFWSAAVLKIEMICGIAAILWFNCKKKKK